MGSCCDTKYRLLEDYFKECPKDQIINLDIKDPGAVDQVVNLIQKYDRRFTTICGSTREPVNTAVLELDPEIPIFCSKRDVIRIIGCYILGLLPYITVKSEHFMFPYYGHDELAYHLKYEDRKKAINGTWWMQLIFVKLAAFTMDPIMAHLKKRGILVTYFVLNHDDDIQYMMKNRIV